MCDQKGCLLGPISQHLHLLASKRRQIETTISPTNQQLVLLTLPTRKSTGESTSTMDSNKLADSGATGAAFSVPGLTPSKQDGATNSTFLICQ